jgi:hypothetical protein
VTAITGFEALPTIRGTEAIAMHPELQHNHPQLQGNVDGVRKCEPWERVVADASPGDHIVQLYQDQDFLNCADCRFVGAGLANREGTNAGVMLSDLEDVQLPLPAPSRR